MCIRTTSRNLNATRPDTSFRQQRTVAAAHTRRDFLGTCGTACFARRILRLEFSYLQLVISFQLLGFGYLRLRFSLVLAIFTSYLAIFSS